jgi:hypothetical protein
MRQNPQHRSARGHRPMFIAARSHIAVLVCVLACPLRALAAGPPVIDPATLGWTERVGSGVTNLYS